MALLTQQSLAVTGTTATYSAVSASDSVTPDSGQLLHVKNGSGASVTVTVVIPGTTWGQANPDIAVTVGAGADKFIPLYPAQADASTGLITVTYSATTSITAALLKV